MIFSVMKYQIHALRVATMALIVCAAIFAHGDKKRDQIVKPIAGPRATALRVTWLYISPDKNSQKVSRVQIGREMVVAEKSNQWLRVYANTDILEEHTSDQPVFGSDEVPPPISGWIEGRGIVVEGAPNGDAVLMGAAENEEALASDPRGPANAAQSARLLYRRLAEMFPNSPLAPEAAWRAADILWQVQKSDFSALPSAKERDPYMRNQMDEEQLKKVIKNYPHTRQADLADFDLIDNKLCGDWQGSTKCPEKESEIYEKYAAEHPESPKAARALYEATYRQAVLSDMYAADGDDKKQQEAHDHAREIALRLKDKFPQSDYTWRALMLVYKLDQGIPVYGIDRDQAS
jgi:outer membrane protein assembly factor BamD (BamD/ComL family)